MARQPLLAFDVGGSYVKAGLVDVQSGQVVRELGREPTPPGATPEGVIDLLASIAARLPSAGPVGFAFPSVTKRGVAYTAANVDRRWIGTGVPSRFSMTPTLPAWPRWPLVRVAIAKASSCY